MSRLSVEQLRVAPELGSLAVLEAALDVAVLALAAAWPELHDIEVHSPDDESRAALDVVERARGLVTALNRYRLALATAERRDHDLPF